MALDEVTLNDSRLTIGTTTLVGHPLVQAGETDDAGALGTSMRILNHAQAYLTFKDVKCFHH